MPDNQKIESGSMGGTPMPHSKNMGETPVLRQGVPRTTPLCVSPSVTRRGMFGALARIGAAAALAAAGAAVSVFRDTDGQSCVNRGLCRGCGVFSNCGLPAALSAKQAGVKS
ncbi:MAG: hypothetical protein LLG01_19950 [Planctomycetaceae bacterium]|nr:hypothetical protein [Planctomycetaceae bacterium]